MQAELESQWEAKCDRMLSTAKEQHARQYHEVCEQRDAQQQKVAQLEEKVGSLFCVHVLLCVCMPSSSTLSENTSQFMHEQLSGPSVFPSFFDLHVIPSFATLLLPIGPHVSSAQIPPSTFIPADASVHKYMPLVG